MKRHALNRARWWLGTLAIGLLIGSAAAETQLAERDVRYKERQRLSGSHRVLRNLEYAIVDGVSLRLDLYLPHPLPPEPLPLVVWVHGGGWRAGSKDRTLAPEALGEAYAVASVAYRLSDVAIFPAQIHDVKAAVRWLRAHATDHGIDPDRFGAWGSSAGGHLVALLGTSCGTEALEGAAGDGLDVSSCVQAVCDFYGPTDLLVLIDQESRVNRRMSASYPEALLLGGTVAERPELARLASPITHVDATDPPFLIVHGDEDSTVPVEQSIDFHAALVEAGVDTTLRIVVGAGHGGFQAEVAPEVKTFFDAHLRGLAPAGLTLRRDPNDERRP